MLEIIQTLARGRGRGENGPLLLLRALDGAPGERIGHIPIDSELSQAWLALMGEPFRPHQSQAITALRRGEPVALFAANPRIASTAYLLAYTLLTHDQSSAVFVAPDARAARAAFNRITYINENLPTTLRLAAHIVEPHVRPNPYARILIATPEALHARLLRHHDRAWNLFWPHARMLALLDLHRYNGIAGAHMTDMLLRVQRIAHAHSGGILPHLLATSWEIDQPQAALESLYNAQWRTIGGDDLPHTPTALAVWRGGDRLRESVDLARALQKQGSHVHVLCPAGDMPAITPLLGETEGISIGPTMQQAHALVSVGYPGTQSALRRLLRAGYQAVIVVLGDMPHEQMLARHTETLLSHPPSRWPATPLNAYVTAAHILCAASELPLTESEVETNGVREIVDRLVANDQLIDLPDPEVAWKPGPAAADPYAEWSMRAASGGDIAIQTEPGSTVDVLDPSLFERWCYPSAALPPLRSGLRVTASDAQESTVNVRLDTSGRRTMPLRRCTVTLREEREERRLFLTSRMGLAKVVVDEEVYGSREVASGGAATETTLQARLTSRWIAPCCWFELSSAPPVNGQLIGWSLAAALTLQALAGLADIVPCYVPESRRLYLIDAQPGGNGCAAWVFQHAEDLLPPAYDIALACRNDPLLEPTARADMDWLLPLLGRRADAAPLPLEVAPRPVASRTASPPTLIEPPKLVLLPAPEPNDQPPKSDRQPASADRRAPADNQRPAPLEPRSAGSNQDAGRRPQSPADMPPRTNTPAVRQHSFDEPHTITPRGKSQPVPTPRAATPPAAPQPPEPLRHQAPAEPAAPDANALIERLRRQRQQRELQQEQFTPATRPAASQGQVELRFKPGDRIFALTYGEGIVRTSYLDDAREMLTVDFPDHGELTIDPAVSLVRKTTDAPDDDDLL